MVQSLYLPLVLVAAVVGMAVAFLAWLQRDAPTAKPLTAFVVLASLWTVAEGLQVATAGLGAMLFWVRVGLTLSALIPVAWLATVLAFTGTDAWLSRTRLAALFVWPAAFTGLVWTGGSGGHDLVWSSATPVLLGEYPAVALEFGLAFWAHQVFTYVLVFAGAALLVRLIMRTEDVFRSQATALLVAIALPMLGNALSVFDLLPSGLDPTGLGYVLAGIVIAGAIFRTQLLSLAPVTRDLGREEVIAEMDDRVITLDEEDRIVDVNEAAEALLGEAKADLRGRPLAAVSPKLADVLEDDASESTDVRLEQDGRLRHYDVRVTPLYRGYGTFAGRVLSLRDVTDRRQRRERLDVLNRLLRHNLRNEMNIVRGNVRMVGDTIANGDAAARLDQVIDTVDTVIDRSDKVGTLSRTMDEEHVRPLSLRDQVEDELATRRQTYPDAEIRTDVPADLWVRAGPSLAVIWNELVTNAIEHNDSETPRVTVAVDEGATGEDYVVVEVTDNGPGLDEQEWRAVAEGRETPLHHGSGVGLWMVTWVVRKYGGAVSFENTDAGCTIRLRLPRADPPADAAPSADAGEQRDVDAGEERDVDAGEGRNVDAGEQRDVDAGETREGDPGEQQNVDAGEVAADGDGHPGEGD